MVDNPNLDLQKLKEFLLECKAIENPITRAQVLGQLPPDIKSQLPEVKPGSSLANIIDDIVTTCDRFEGGIKTFVDLVGQSERSTTAIKKINNLMSSSTPTSDSASPKLSDSLTAADLVFIEQLVQAMKPSDTHLYRTYQYLLNQSNSDILDLERASCTSEKVPQVLEYLGSRATDKQGVQPLLLFVAYLASNHPAIGQQLLNWMKREQQRLHLSDSGIELFQNIIAQPMSFPTLGTPYLIVSITPLNVQSEEMQQQKFKLQAWFWNNLFKEAVMAKRLEESYQENELPEIVNWLISFCFERYLGDLSYEDLEDPILLVEIFLPCSHLDHPVQDWRKKKGSNLVPITSQYPIVIRPLMRLQANAESRMLWKACWKNFKQKLVNGRWFCHLLQIGPEQIFSFQQTSNLPAEPLIESGLPWRKFMTKLELHVTTLVLTFVPRNVLTTETLMENIVSVGMPVVIWPSEEVRAKDFMRAVEDLTSDNNLLELPILLWQKQKEGVLEDDEAIQRCTLLFDNPDRLPEDYAPVAVLSKPTTRTGKHFR